MTRATYKQLVHELNAAHRFGNSIDYSAVYAMAALRRARQIVLEMGRPEA